MSAQLEIPLTTDKPEDGTTSAQEGTVTKSQVQPNATEHALRDKGKPPAEKPAATPENPAAEKPAAPAEKATSETPLEIKVPDKVDFAAVAKEYQEAEGKLSPQTLKLLESKGITEDLVQTFIDGQKARAQVLRSELAQSVGGDETLSAVLQWAATGLNPEEVQTYNALLKSPDVAAQKVALMALKGRMDADLGTEGTRVNAEGVPGTRGIEPIGSNAELVSLMRSKEYKTDPAFRAKVTQRLKVSTL
jgi:hypothetical protein